MVYHKSIKGELALSPAFGLDPEFELLSTKGEMLAYSPNGEQLALTPGTDRNLMVMNGDGTHAHKVFDSGGKVIAFPAWSPDARYIAFGIGGFFERPVVPGQLALIRPDGSGLRMLTEGNARRAFELLDASGLLAHVLPEAARMKGVAQPPQSGLCINERCALIQQ